MSSVHTAQFRVPRLVGVALGSLLAVAAVLGAAVMLAAALAVSLIGALLRPLRARDAASAGPQSATTIPVEYSVVRESASGGGPQRGGNVPESGGLATKASNELS